MSETETDLIATSVEELDHVLRALAGRIAADEGKEPVIDRLLAAAVMVRHARAALTDPHRKAQRDNVRDPETEAPPRVEVPPPCLLPPLYVSLRGGSSWTSD